MSATAIAEVESVVCYNARSDARLKRKGKIVHAALVNLGQNKTGYFLGKVDELRTVFETRKFLESCFTKLIMHDVVQTTSNPMRRPTKEGSIGFDIVISKRRFLPARKQGSRRSRLVITSRKNTDGHYCFPETDQERTEN